MATKVVQQESVSAKLVGRWEQLTEKLTALAQEFPENKFDYKPIESARTIAEVLRHVAFWNRYVADTVSGRRTDDTANELPKDEFSTKTQIVQVLKRTAADATEALKKNLPNLNPDVAELLVTFLEHNCEHYGQLVVYARLNRIVPPTSRS